MKKQLFTYLYLLAVSLFAVAPAMSQTAEYTLNKDKSQISLIVDTKQTKYTVADIVGRKEGRALKEAKAYALNINADTVGTWTKLPSSENVWKLVIDVPDAKAFFVNFDEFYLPEDAQLYVYNKNELKDAVVFSHKDNPRGGAYSIDGLKGDNVVLEYVSGEDGEKPKFTLSYIGYKYSEVLHEYEESGSCMINVNCTEGELWQKQKKGVVQIRLKKANTFYLCSGTLINNTSNDKKPYVLTAYHCVENMTPEQIKNNTYFYFGYETPSCENTEKAPEYKFLKGSDVKVLNPIGKGGDGALLELSESIPDDWDVYFNGWDVEDNSANIKNGTVIHHPLGDVKKISLYKDSPTKTNWKGGAAYCYWDIKYTDGVTEGGSSGAPLFNNNGLIVGTLTGGENFLCNSADKNKVDSYGGFYYNWDKYTGTPEFTGVDTHLKTYLDPLNTGAKKLEGLYSFGLEKTRISMMPNTTTSVRIIGDESSYIVSSSDLSIIQASVANNLITISATGKGNATITVTDSKDKSIDIYVTVVTQPVDIVMDLMGKNLVITAYNEEDAIDQIRLINLDADVLRNEKNVNLKTYSVGMEYFKSGVYIVQIKTKKGVSRTEKILWRN